MKIPEKYIREAKLQKLIYIIFPLAGIIGAIIFNEAWIRILFASLFCMFATVLLFNAYLSIKYSLIHLTTGVYSKKENPLIYYAMTLVSIFGGIYMFVTAYNALNYL